MSAFIRKLEIPVYDAQLWVCVFPKKSYNSDCSKAYKRFLKEELPPSEFEGSGATHAWTGKKHLLLFQKELLNIDHLSHEVFHLTHRILEYRDFNFDSDHHEQGAYLHGWIMGKVSDMLFKVSPKRL